MNFLILNGSPKGEASVTLQTSLYLEKRFPDHRFTVLHAGRQPDFPLTHPAEFARQTAAADCVIFSYPVYTFLIPAQLMRFMEAMKASGVSLKGKYASQITTSKHFYDMTAHRFVRENAQDMGMRFVEGLSADMEDLLSEKGRREAEQFFRYLLFSMKYNLSEPIVKPVVHAHRPVTVPALSGEKDNSRRVAIVADLREDDGQLRDMIDRFRAVFPYGTDLVNLEDFPFRGGCLGCLNCMIRGKCVYRDGFDKLLREKILPADAIVYAFTLRDHSMGSRFKLYDDRQFFNGCRSLLEGRPIACLVNGDMGPEENLRTVLEARAAVGHSFFAGFASGAEEICALSARLVWALEHRYAPPRSFYGVGGTKIVRDHVWLKRGLMREDHLFFKARGLYDFPRRHWVRMLGLSLLGALMRSRRLRRLLGDRMNASMLAPYQKVLNKLSQEGSP